MKQLITLIIITLLIVTTFVIPVDSSVFSLNMANIFAPEVEDTVLPPNKFALSKLNAGDNLFCFAIDSTRSLTDEERKQLTFQATLTDYSGSSRDLTLDDFEYDIAVDAQRTTYTIKDLKTITPYRSDDIRATVSLKDTTIELSAYLFSPASGLKANGKTADDVTAELVPIFYSSLEQQLNYPVYTKPAAGSNDFRRMLSSISHTPNYYGLAERARFPAISYVWYSAGVLDLKLITSQITEFSDPAIAQYALDDLLKTFRYTMGNYVVNKISLSVDGQKTSTAFGGIDISQDFSVTRDPVVYLPLIQNEQTTWLPQAIEASESVDQMCRQIVAIYKRSATLPNQKSCPPLLAKDVELEDVQVVGNTLKLTFNGAFKQRAKQGGSQYCAALLEGLTLSTTSLPFIENIELYVGTNKLTTIGDCKIDNPISPPTYFNVDLDYLK